MKAKRTFHIIMSLLLSAASWAQGGQTDETPGLLKGTLHSMRTTGGAAVLRNGGSGLGFYASATSMSVAANTAFVERSGTVLINLESLDQAADGIKEIGRRQTAKTKAVYDVSGRQVHTGHNSVHVVIGQRTDGSTEVKKVILK